MATRAEQAAAAAVTATYVARQRILATALTRDLILLVRQLFVPATPGPSWAATKVQLDTLVRARRGRAAGLAARYYVDLRGVYLPPTGGPRLPVEVAASAGEVERPSAREVLDAVTREPQSAPVRADTPVADLDAEFGLGDIGDADVWAELGRIAGVQPSDLDDDRVESNLDTTGIAAYQKAVRAGQAPEQATDTMAVNLAGSVTRLAQEGGREVIRDAVEGDDEAIGWIRITDADPCSWCVMLASRGAVFRSAGTAGRTQNGRFDGEGQFKWHDHCGCTAQPIFDPDDPRLEKAEDLYDQWLRATQGHSGKAAVNAWRRHWDNRDQEG